MMMKILRHIAISAVLLIAGATAASAQCSSQAPGGTLCGNNAGSLGLAGYKTNPVLGIPGTSTGQIGFAGAASGTATLKAQAAAGSATVLLPTSAGTLVSTAASPLAIDPVTGQESITGLAGGVLAGAGPAFTRTPVLGASGTLGSLGFGNATSGIVTLQTVTGALGTVTVSLPAASGTVAVSASSPLVLGATSGALTCPTCVTSSGGGSITGVAPVAVSAAGAVSITGAAGQVLAGASPAFTATPTLGIAGSQIGTLAFAGNTSGTATITPQAAAGTPTLTLPNASGTFAVSATSPLSLSATTGALTVTTGTLTSSNDTNVTITLGGTPTNALFNAVSLTMGWTGQLGLTRGGTAASLTASNGGLVYSTASALAILSGTATANQIPLSGSSAAPSWSTATYPATAAAGTILGVASSNVIAATATPTLGANGGTGGQVTLNGSTSGSVALRVAAAAGTSTIFQLPATNGTNGYVLQTDGSGVTSWVNPTSGGTVTTITAGTGITLSSGATCTTTCTIGNGGVTSIAGNTGAFTLSTGLTNSTNAILIDKATSANLEAGTSNKVLTSDIIYDGEVALTFSATPTWDFSTFLNARLTLTGNITSLTCSNIKASQSGAISLVQDGTGSRTMVAGWCSQFRWAGGSRGVLSTAINAIDTLFYQCISTSVCYVSLGKAQAN